MAVRRLSAQDKNEQGLHSWDLAPFRLPRHPKYRDLDVVSKVKYICLDFPTVEGQSILEAKPRACTNGTDRPRDI